ncbi:MAG: site-specific DNA-methyltransferase [Candidatus Atabeyarchaeum deiterrae]
MSEVEDGSVHLIVTSPPYPMIEMWDGIFRNLDDQIDRLWLQLEKEEDRNKREGIVGKIYDSMHENLAKVWSEVHRVLIDGGIACINIGDATRNINGIFRLFPNHVRVVDWCERIGFVTLPYLLWRKPTTKPKYKGKGAFLGSGMLPPNAYVTLDCEYILILRKGGLRQFASKDPIRYSSKYTKEERDKWFTQIWDITGMKQHLSEVERRAAAFPEEIPKRLIRMFSVAGDTILDPFLGTGTSLKVAIALNRSMIGYEIDNRFGEMIQKEITSAKARFPDMKFEVISR